MSEINIKPFNNDVLSGIMPALLEIDEKVFGKYEVWSRENFLKSLPGKEDYSCIVLSKSSIIAYMIAYLSDSSTLHLSRIAVLDAYRGEGIGKLLIEKLISEARKNNLKCITLEFEFSLNVKKFYEKFGFEILKGNEINGYLEAKNKTGKVHLYLSNNPERGIMVNKKL